MAILDEDEQLKDILKRYNRSFDPRYESKTNHIIAFELVECLATLHGGKKLEAYKLNKWCMNRLMSVYTNNLVELNLCSEEKIEVPPDYIVQPWTSRLVKNQAQDEYYENEIKYFTESMVRLQADLKKLSNFGMFTAESYKLIEDLQSIIRSYNAWIAVLQKDRDELLIPTRKGENQIFVDAIMTILHQEGLISDKMIRKKQLSGKVLKVFSRHFKQLESFDPSDFNRNLKKQSQKLKQKTSDP